LRLRIPRQLSELTTGNGEVSSETRSGRIHVPGAQAVNRAASAARSRLRRTPR
jgi:hypothetical protein